jgi:hypothetical protein
VVVVMVSAATGGGLEGGEVERLGFGVRFHADRQVQSPGHGARAVIPRTWAAPGARR